VIARMARLLAVAALLVLAVLLLMGGFGNRRAQAADPVPAATAAAAPAAAGQQPAGVDPAPALTRGEQVREELRQTPRNLREVWSTLVDRTLEHLPGIVIGILVLAVFWAIGRVTARLLRRLFQRSGADPALASVIVPLSKVALFLIGLLAAMEQMGFNVGSLLAGLGVAGLAVGLAAQETLTNVFGGFVLLWDRPFRLGDYVTIKGTSGHVMGIGLRSTRLRTLEHREVTLPNRQVIQEQIVNHTRYPKVRLNVPVSIAYGADLERVRAVLLGSIAANPGVVTDPPPQVVVVALGEAGVQVELRVWVGDQNAEGANIFRLLEDAKRELHRAGIEIPFPQRIVQVVGAAPPGASR
jgi:small conductance mechanosensitive channel